MYSSMWQQAAAEGITVIVSTGDNGSAGCDVTEINGAPTGPAIFGLEVNGIASTPFNVAVGGTDFDDFHQCNSVRNSTNVTGTQASAKSYIPETTWNDTCTNVVVYQPFSVSRMPPRPVTAWRSKAIIDSVSISLFPWGPQVARAIALLPMAPINQAAREEIPTFLAGGCNAEY